MVKETEGWFVLSDGLELYEKTWEPSTVPRAHVVLLHGWNDRADLYSSWCSTLVSSFPLRVTAYDRRGWGKSVHSPSERGLAGPNTTILSDLNEYLWHITSTIPDAQATPLFVIAHSMGGQEVLYYLLSTAYEGKRPPISGLVLNAPYIAMATRPNALEVAIGKLAGYFFPMYHYKPEQDPSCISRDETVCQAWKEDELCHGYGTLEALRDTLVREAELTQLADPQKPVLSTLSAKLLCAVFWTHGTADKAVSFSVSRQLFERLEPHGGRLETKTFKAYEGWYHQLHSEPNGGKEEYARDVGEWVMETTAKIAGRGRTGL